MKTPKREQEKCWRCGGDLVVRHGCSGSFCPTCNYYVNVSPRLMEQHARWIRKNREKRLRHALRKKDEVIDYAANVVQRMENEACDEYEHQLRLRLSLAATRTLNNFQRGFINASGTYGQDIEGS